MFEIILIAAGLSMDAFAVSISDGISFRKISLRNAVPIAFCFGLFQAVMPLFGFLLGDAFTEVIGRYDHYIALVFLGFIGGKMIYGAVSEKPESNTPQNPEQTAKLKVSFPELMLQSVATSIDALVVGVSFVALGLDFSGALASVAVIGGVTFVLSLAGVFAGKKIGGIIGKKAEIFGGIVLVGIGIKIFIEHMFFA